MATFRPASALSSPNCSCNRSGFLLQHTEGHTIHLRCLLKHFLKGNFSCPTCLQSVSFRNTFSNREILVGGLKEGTKAAAENADQAAKAFLFSAAVYACISLGRYILYPA